MFALLLTQVAAATDVPPLIQFGLGANLLAVVKLIFDVGRYAQRLEAVEAALRQITRVTLRAETPE